MAVPHHLQEYPEQEIPLPRLVTVNCVQEQQVGVPPPLLRPPLL